MQLLLKQLLWNGKRENGSNKHHSNLKKGSDKTLHTGFKTDEWHALESLRFNPQKYAPWSFGNPEPGWSGQFWANYTQVFTLKLTLENIIIIIIIIIPYFFIYYFLMLVSV